MRTVDPGIRVTTAQILHSLVHVVDPTSRACGIGRSRRYGRAAAILNIEDSYLGITGAGHDGSVVGMGHEFDGKYVCRVARRNGGIEKELRR